MFSWQADFLPLSRLVDSGGKLLLMFLMLFLIELLCRHQLQLKTSRLLDLFVIRSLFLIGSKSNERLSYSKNPQ